MRISVSVRIPAISHTHNFSVPDNMATKNVIELMVAILSSEYGISNISSDVCLIDKADSKSLPLSHSFSQLGVLDGANLILL